MCEPVGPESVRGTDPVETSAEASSPYRVVIADDHPAMRAVLAELIGGHPRLQVVAVANDAAEAVSFCSSHRPDVVLLDAAMPHGGGAHAARIIAADHPSVRIVCLTAYTDERTRQEMLRAGAHLVLHKGGDEDIAELLVELPSMSPRR